MVLPLIPLFAGVGAFIAFGKDLIGVKMFNTVYKIGILIGIGVLGYLGYKMYRVKEDTEDYIEGGMDWFKDTTTDTLTYLNDPDAISEDIYDLTKKAPEIVSESWEQKYAEKVAEDLAPKLESGIKDVYNAPTYVIITARDKIIEGWDKLWKK